MLTRRDLMRLAVAAGGGVVAGGLLEACGGGTVSKATPAAEGRAVACPHV